MRGSRPFIVSRTCKREHADRHAQLISTVIAACNAEVSMIGCPLFTITSDGESRRGSALSALTHLRPLDPDSGAHVAQTVVMLVRISCKKAVRVGKAHVDP